MSNYFNTDWKKLASATATSDSDIEKAFADQASGFVDNKLPALMQGDYQIGFEVVKKNDDNTRMVGVFAFKVEKSLIFAPVFFINGEIKGPLLYRTDTRTFVPANKEWASYLVSSLERKEGDPSARSDRRKYPPLVRMDLINMVPGTQKKASADEGDFGVKVKVHKGYPHTIPNGTCTVKLDISHPAEPATWNNRLPCGESILHVTSGKGWLECCCKSAGYDYPAGITSPDETFLFTAKDAELFKSATPFDRSVAISDETGETWYEMGPLQANLFKERFFSGDTEGYKKEASLDWGEVEKIMDWPVTSEGLIHSFLLEPDYGKPAAEAIVKAASSDYEFAEMLATIYGKDNGYIPDHFNVTEKSASADTIGEVGIVNDISVFAKADEVLGEHMDVPGEFFKDGFFMYDTRMPDSKSVTYKTEESNITTPETAGVYSLVKDNGEWEDNVLVLPYQGDNLLAQWRPAWEDDEEPTYTSEKSTQGKPGKKIVYKDGKVLCGRYFLGMRTGDVEDADGILSTMAPGNVYFMILDGKASGPYVIGDKSEADGVQYWKLIPQHGWDVDRVYTESFGGEGKEVTFNPGIEKSDLKHNLIGKDARFIRVRTSRKSLDGGRRYATSYEQMDELEGIAKGSTALTNFVFDRWKLPKVSVTRQMGPGAKVVYQAEGLGEKSASMNKRAMMVKLAVDLRIDSEEAYRILDEADAKGRAEFLLEPHEKIASKLHLVDSPQFQDEFDPDQGVTISPVQTFRLGIHGDQTFEPASAIGDMVNPTSLTGLPNATVVNTDPAELRALADTYSLPNVFEHGVVGTLANTFNAVGLVDKYVAKLEDGVDALGRIKFLLHWCPQDFERVYGSDDMVNMEAQVDANFTSLGALLLDLLKKTEKQRMGQVDEGSPAGEKTK